MSVFVDADSVPSRIREIILRRCEKDNIETFFVSDRALKDVCDFIRISTEKKREPFRNVLNKEELKKLKCTISMIIVESAENAADDKIVSLAHSPALAITHDIPLASRLLEKGITVIDERGYLYTTNTIKERLSEREIMKNFREMGLDSGKTKPFNSKIVNNFASTFDKEINKLMKLK